MIVFLVVVVIGHVLLERYGMTEIGMCLSNPYNGVRMPVN